MTSIVTENQVKFVNDEPFAEEEEWEWMKLLDIMKAEVKEVEQWDGGDIDW